MKTHMKTAAFGCLALAAMGASAAAEEEEFFPDINNISVESGYMFDMGNGLSADHLWGGNLGIGYSFAETSKSYQSLYAKIGLFAGSDGEETSYYNKGVLIGGKRPPAAPGNYKYSQRIIPLTVGYEYNYKLTPSVNIFAGVNGGCYFSKTERKGVGLLAEDHWYLLHKTVSSVSPVLGINLGASYQVAPRWKCAVGINIQQVFGIAQENPSVFERNSKKSTVTGTVYAGVTYTY